MRERDQDLPSTQQGLFNKYSVVRGDGKVDHEGAEYFVLRLDGLDERPADAAALATYCTAVYPTHPMLAAALASKLPPVDMGKAREAAVNDINRLLPSGYIIGKPQGSALPLFGPPDLGTVAHLSWEGPQDTPSIVATVWRMASGEMSAAQRLKAANDATDSARAEVDRLRRVVVSRDMAIADMNRQYGGWASALRGILGTAPMQRAPEGGVDPATQADSARAVSSLVQDLAHEREQLKDYHTAMLATGYDETVDRQTWAAGHAARDRELVHELAHVRAKHEKHDRDISDISRAYFEAGLGASPCTAEKVAEQLREAGFWRGWAIGWAAHPQWADREANARDNDSLREAIAERIEKAGPTTIINNAPPVRPWAPLEILGSVATSDADPAVRIEAVKAIAAGRRSQPTIASHSEDLAGVNLAEYEKVKARCDLFNEALIAAGMDADEDDPMEWAKVHAQETSANEAALRLLGVAVWEAGPAMEPDPVATLVELFQSSMPPSFILGANRGNPDVVGWSWRTDVCGQGFATPLLALEDAWMRHSAEVGEQARAEHTRVVGTIEQVAKEHGIEFDRTSDASVSRAVVALGEKLKGNPHTADGCARLTVLESALFRLGMPKGCEDVAGWAARRDITMCSAYEAEIGLRCIAGELDTLGKGGPPWGEIIKATLKRVRTGKPVQPISATVGMVTRRISASAIAERFPQSKRIHVVDPHTLVSGEHDRVTVTVADTSPVSRSQETADVVVEVAADGCCRTTKNRQGQLGARWEVQRTVVGQDSLASTIDTLIGDSWDLQAMGGSRADAIRQWETFASRWTRICAMLHITPSQEPPTRIRLYHQEYEAIRAIVADKDTGALPEGAGSLVDIVRDLYRRCPYPASRVKVTTDGPVVNAEYIGETSMRYEAAAPSAGQAAQVDTSVSDVEAVQRSRIQATWREGRIAFIMRNRQDMSRTYLQDLPDSELAAVATSTAKAMGGRVATIAAVDDGLDAVRSAVDGPASAWTGITWTSRKGKAKSMTMPGLSEALVTGHDRDLFPPRRFEFVGEADANKLYALQGRRAEITVHLVNGAKISGPMTDWIYERVAAGRHFVIQVTPYPAR